MYTRRASFQPMLEILEERCVPAVIDTVFVPFKLYEIMPQLKPTLGLTSVVQEIMPQLFPVQKPLGVEIAALRYVAAPPGGDPA